MSEEKYVVIMEHKADAPLVMEQYLGSADYESVHARMLTLQSQHNTIRVAMARLVYETGNETLVPKVSE